MIKIKNIFGKIKKKYITDINQYLADNYRIFETSHSDDTYTESKVSETSHPYAHASTTPDNSFVEIPSDDNVRYSLKSTSDLQYELTNDPSLYLLLNNVAEDFGTVVVKIMMLKQKTAADIYKSAGISRQLFNNITNNKDYHPSKPTVMALLCALELTYSESEKFLQHAGYAFSPSSKFDLIVGYCIKHGIYSVMDINEILNYYGQDILGSK